MNRRFTIASLLALSGALALPAQSAEAQCSSDDTFCASVETPIVRGAIRVRRRPVVSQVIVTTPTPPPPPRVIVTQPAPPPPPPRVIVTQPAPPPPAPVTNTQTITVETEQEFRLVPEDRFLRRFGIVGRGSWITAVDQEMGGARFGARVRPGGRAFGLELTVGAFGGVDYNSENRLEIPTTFNLMYFIGIGQSRRFELYTTIGAGVSWGRIERFDDDGAWGWGTYEAHNTWVGGEAGFGMEWHISRHFALDLDFRAMLRSRVATDDPYPEFYEREYYDSGEITQSTNLSWAPSINFGGVFYF